MHLVFSPQELDVGSSGSKGNKNLVTPTFSTATIFKNVSGVLDPPMKEEGIIILWGKDSSDVNSLLALLLESLQKYRITSMVAADYY